MEEERNKREAEGKGRNTDLKKVYSKETLTHGQYSSRRDIEG